MKIKELKTLQDFQELKKGDIVACEFYRNMYQGRGAGFTFKVFEIAMNKENTNEIILDKKWNLYFNYKMFVEKDSGSNLKGAILIYK